ncbi:MAG: ABC transporter ATP-binding protein [Flavobacteriales bacterium]|nr:ABC transporter ATP-binding protein [Flavobacteriales bacterium]
MIQATNIYKRYGSLEVLKGVSLEIKQGEIVCIIGKSGAGKSTLLHILGTLDRPESGEISIDGIRTDLLNDKKLSEFRNKHIGFVFQFHHLLPEFNALENVCMPAYIRKTPRKQAEQRAKELLDYLGLSHRITHKPSELSGGEQQRVAIARALINNPTAIFADEPTGNLDTQTSSELHQLFLKLRQEFNQTFVIVTHNPELAELANRTVRMEDGLIKK